MKEWYIIYNGTRQGPMPADRLADYGLNPSSMVWTAGMSDWRAAGTCAELAIYLNGAAGNGNTPPPSAGAQRQDYVDIDVSSGPSAGGAGQPGGYPQPDPMNPGNWRTPFDTHPEPGYGQWSGKSKIVAGLFAIFLGYLGVQYFYCDKVGAGFITILLSLVTCGGWSVVTLIQGIYMLTLTDRQFDDKYVYNKATFPLF